MGVIQFYLMSRAVESEIKESLCCIDTIQCEEERILAQCECAYYNGNIDKATVFATELYKSKDEIYSIIGESYLVFISILLGDIHLSMQVFLEKLNTIIQKKSRDNEQEEQLEFLKFIYFFASAFSQLDSEDIEPNPRKLNPGIRLSYFYVIAFKSYLKNDHNTSIAIAKTALDSCAETYIISQVYLHMMLATNYVCIDDIDQAKGHFEKAWELAHPVQIILPFVELSGTLYAFLKQIIQPSHPELYEQIYEYVESFSQGWFHVSNKEQVKEMVQLSAVEFAVSILVKNGWKNKEIASYLQISLAMVKLHISNIFYKLNISSRKELEDIKLK